MKSKFEIKGLEEYLQTLEKAGVDINLVSRGALKECGELLQSAMKSRVPVDTGNLQDHIRIKTPTVEGDYNYVFVGIIHDAAYTDAKTAIQANAVEYGSTRMNAKPFVRPAINASRSRVNNIVKERLKNAGLVD